MRYFKTILTIIVFSFLTLFYTSQVNAINVNQLCVGDVRCAECNACGYCLRNATPGNLEQCMRCLYPSVSVVNTQQTLFIDPQTNRPAMQKAPGKYFTQLGCVDTNVSSFTDPTAAGGVLNFLLSYLIFPTVGVIAFLYLIYGAFLIMTAQGNREQLGSGKRMVLGAIVGLIFTLSTVLIVNFIGVQILNLPVFRE